MSHNSETPPLPALYEVEAEIMESLWRLGSATVREVIEELESRGAKKRAYTTVMTVMGRLDRKGLLEHRKDGKSYVYVPAASRDEYFQHRARAEVDALIQQYGDLALAQFTRRVDELDPERHQQLRDLAGDA